MRKFRHLRSQEFGKEIAEKLGVEKAKQIIIDVNAGEPLMIYVAYRGDERALEINFDNLLADVEEVEEKNE